MSADKISIGFVRRGYSASGGAEAYLKRLAAGVVARGHEAQLFTTSDWPKSEWPFGPIIQLRATAPIAFATQLEELRHKVRCNVIMSLERVCTCDVYRAGDGVHQAWLNRRAKFDTPLQKILHKLNGKHRDILRLEKALLDDRGAGRVIANSQMVKNEIIEIYNYRRDQIDLIRNGIPLEQFRFDPNVREQARAELNLKPGDPVALFVGTGWERKGLRFAINAVEADRNPRLRLLVAGRGPARRYQSARVQFLGQVTDLSRIYLAADFFILPTLYDPFSNASLEALAFGLPVITTRANGFSEVIEDRIHGSLVDAADDLPALRKAVEVWSDPTWRRAARPSILKRALQFDISKNVDQTLDVLVQAATEAALRSGNMRKT